MLGGVRDAVIGFEVALKGFLGNAVPSLHRGNLATRSPRSVNSL